MKFGLNVVDEEAGPSVELAVPTPAIVDRVPFGEAKRILLPTESAM
jgi:hypothetical protein